MRSGLFPLILILSSAAALPGCTEQAPLPEALLFQESASAAYDILAADSNSNVGSLTISSRASASNVTQELRMTFLDRLFEFTSKVDSGTGRLQSWSNAMGTTFPAGVDAQIPSLGRNLFPKVYEAPVTLGFYGLPWAAVHLESRSMASVTWGNWAVVKEEHDRGTWVNATAPCDSHCGPNSPIWQTSYLMGASILPLEVVLASSTSPGYRLVAHGEPLASGPQVSLAPDPPQERPEHLPDDACLPIPCEGLGLPPEFRFANAFESLQGTIEWQGWADGKTPLLQMLSVARAHASETLGMPAPILATHWGFVFHSNQGDEAIFFMRSFRIGETWTPPVLIDSTITSQAPNFDLTTPERQFAAADLAVLKMVQQESWHASEEFSLLLSVGYGKLNPNPTLQIVWTLLDSSTNGVTLASGHDGRLLGIYPEGILPS